MSLVPLKIAESLQFNPSSQVIQKLNFCLQIDMENFFVYIYSKKILQGFLSSNKQKTTSNKKRETSKKFHFLKFVLIDFKYYFWILIFIT